MCILASAFDLTAPTTHFPRPCGTFSCPRWTGVGLLPCWRAVAPYPIFPHDHLWRPAFYTTRVLYGTLNFPAVMPWLVRACGLMVLVGHAHGHLMDARRALPAHGHGVMFGRFSRGHHHRRPAACAPRPATHRARHALLPPLVASRRRRALRRRRLARLPPAPRTVGCVRCSRRLPTCPIAGVVVRCYSLYLLCRCCCRSVLRPRPVGQ